MARYTCAILSGLAATQVESLSQAQLWRSVAPHDATGPHDIAVDPDREFHWRLCDATLAHSNLGGQGPDNGPEEILYKNAGVKLVDGQQKSIDLRVKAVGTYTANNPDLNKIKGCFGVINVAKDSAVKLEFEFLWSDGTAMEELVDSELTIYDVDNADRGGNIEHVIFDTDIDAYRVSDTSELLESGGDGTGPLHIRSGNHGGGYDNPGSVPDPTDPEALSSQQLDRSVSVYYHEKNKWQVTFGSEKGRRGRNFLFGGHSMLFPPNRTDYCGAFPQATLDFSLCERREDGSQRTPGAMPMYNNLGGKGPAEKQPEELRFRDITTRGWKNSQNGQHLDLRVKVNEASSEYQAWNASQNGLHGCFGVINVKSSTSVTLDFTLLKAGTDEPYQFHLSDQFGFTVFDIDNSNYAQNREVVTFNSPFVGTPRRGNQLRMTNDSPYSFESKSWGNGTDNVLEGSPDYTPPSKTSNTDRSIEVLYNQSTWTITFEAAGGLMGRNFLFGGCME